MRGPARVALVAALVVGSACARPAAPPSEPLRFRADEGVFTLLAWMNAAGYAYDAPGVPLHPVRQALRQSLAGHAAGSADRQAFYRASLATATAVAGSPAAQRPGLGAFILSTQLLDYLSLLTPVPTLRHTWQPLGRNAGDSLAAQELVLWWRYGGLAEQLRRFSREANVPALWRQHKPAYEQVIRQIEPASRAAVATLRSHLGLGQGVPVTVIPDLLGQHFVGHTARSQGQAFLVIGPQPHPADYGVYVRHEYLHPQLDPLVERHRGLVQPAVDALFTLIEDSSAVTESGYDRLTIVEESLIRAIEGHFVAPESLDPQYRRGFLLVPVFAEKLETYRKDHETIEAFIRRAFAAVDPAKEARRWRQRQRPRPSEPARPPD